MARKSMKYGNTLGIINQFDFNSVYCEELSDRQFASSQQEFLIKSQLPLNVIDDIEVICQNVAAVECLSYMLEDNNPFKDKIKVDERMYHGRNPKFLIVENPKSLKISIQQEKKDGKIILKYFNKNDADNVKSEVAILVPETMTVSIDIKSINYAIFYAHNGHIWLIATNHKHPKFTLPHVRQLLEDYLDNITAMDPAYILDILKEHPVLQYLYEQAGQNGHTLTVMEMFKQHCDIQSNIVSKSFYILLALHAVGLPEAKLANKEQDHQRFTLKIVAEVCDIIPLSNSVLQQIKKFIDSDHIRNLVYAYSGPSATNLTSIIQTMWADYNQQFNLL
ncbi:unnamed protein product [Didymodactylos carnosus]|nr:unnamed protein product [Didymodactylos carnosus]CAF4142112.1 unnamed protein product [Didymodactylos carnosus]